MLLYSNCNDYHIPSNEIPILLKSYNAALPLWPKLNLNNDKLNIWINEL